MNLYRAAMARRAYTEGTWRKDPWFRELCRAFVACKSEEEMAELLRDIGTLMELQAWSERLEVARQLQEGKAYRSISRKTGASTTTITRVAHFVEDGAGGYRRNFNLKQHHRHHTTSRGERMASMM